MIASDTAPPACDGAGFRPGVSMLGWALNEEMNIRIYVERAEAFLRSVSNDFELILVDDGSTDGMWALAEEAQRSRPWLCLLRNAGNRGAAYSAKRAIRQASKTYVLWQTVDWAYDLSHLPAAFPQLQRYDVLQGVRSNALTLGAVLTHRSDNRWKGLISYVNYWMIRLLFGLPLSDYQNVTVYPRPLLQSFECETDSSFMNPELLLKAWWHGASFKEVHVPFIKRQGGVAKGTRPLSILKSIRDIGYWWLRWVVLGHRPEAGRGTVVSSDAS